MYSVNWGELNKALRVQGKNRIVEFHKFHLDWCDLNEFDQRNMDVFENYSEYLEHFAENGTALTWLNNGNVLGMFGLWPLWPGVAEFWLIPSRNIGRKTIPFHRGALAFFPFAAQHFGIKRLQFTVHSLNAPARQWAERCYFSCEGKLKHFGPDESDYYMYARIIT